MNKNIHCPCQSIKCTDRNNLLQEFTAIREKCTALKEILVPDCVWADFQKNAEHLTDNTVGHKHKVLGAFQHGILSKITFPIHRYLMDDNIPKKLKNDYKKDLVERWTEQKTPLKRHQKSRGHDGKINELLCAAWLEHQGWEIDNLEALDGDYDIEATSPGNSSTAIEVKFIGLQNEKFKEHEKCCISHKAIAGTIPIYDGYNYFLFRTYEAASPLC